MDYRGQMIKVDDVVNGKKKQKNRGTGENTKSIVAPKVLEKGTATAAVPKRPTIAERVEESIKLTCEGLGLEDPELAEALIIQAKQLESAMSVGGGNGLLEMATPLLFELKPKNLSQALLAVQMGGVHYAVCLCMKRAGTTLSYERQDAYLVLAMRLMRLFIEQLETLAKLKGKGGQQRVTVKYVQVNKGGQAIVGAVTAAKHEETNDQSQTKNQTKIGFLKKREPTW